MAVAARIGIVNYGMGNLRSVEKAVERVGAVPVISGDPEQLAELDGLILPGVGAFPKAMERIRETGLDRFLHERAEAGTPILGVCLGMQLLCDFSTEGGGASGLGLLPGEVRELDAKGLKLPHIGWSPLRIERQTRLTEGIDSGEPFYFVHSFAPDPEPEHLLASASHGERFAAVIGADRAGIQVYGAQFHPEKSSTAGLRMLGNFAAICSPVATGA